MHGFDFLTAPVDGGTFLLLIVLYFLGARLVQGREKLQTLGKRIALVTFFVFVALLAYEWKPSAADEWAMILLRSLIFAGIVLGAAWTILPPLAIAYSSTFGVLFRKAGAWMRLAQQRADQKRADLERQRQDEEWEWDRPRREAEAIAAAQRAEVAAAAQKRREDARAACESLYLLATPEIGTRFPKQDFVEFIGKYMTDAFSPEAVEERAEQLKAIIRQHQEKVDPSPKFQSLQELTAWFEERVREIEQISDDRLKKTLLVELKGKYSELTSRFLAEMSP